MDISQPVFDRTIIPNSDVLHERPEIRKEARESGQRQHPEKRITPPSVTRDRYYAEQRSLTDHRLKKFDLKARYDLPFLQCPAIPSRF